MVRRKINDPCTEPVNFRVSLKMKSEMDSAADTERISTNEWIRKAIQEKLDRKTGIVVTDDELDARIEKTIKKFMERKE